MTEKTAKPAAEPKAPKIVSFTLNRDALDEALKACKKLVPAKIMIPILGHVRIRAVRGEPIQVIATDLDVELACAMPDVAKRAIDVTIPFHLLSRVVRAGKNDETVKFDVEITSRMERVKGAPEDAKPEKVTFGIVTMYADGLEVVSDEESRPHDFPSLPDDLEAGPKVTLDADKLFTALTKCSHAMSTEETRYYLRGVYFDAKRGEGLRLVATDGHRMAQCDTGVKTAAKYGQWDAIVPAGVVDLQLYLLGRDDGVEKVPLAFAKGRNYANAAVGRFSMTFKLIDGTYPDYERVMPDPKYATCGLSVDPVAFYQAISKVIAVGRDQKAVKLTPNCASIAIEQGGHGSAKVKLEIPCEIEGESIEIGANARYLQALADLIEGDALKIEYADPGSPMRVTDTGDPRMSYVLMPMRV